ASRLLENTNIMLGAQNMHYEDAGAFTGEISPVMLKELGCKHVIIGHSERRQHFNESNEFLNKKIISALKHGIRPILCVGESKEERDSGKEKRKVQGQIESCLKDISGEEMLNIAIAYEPIWAIGTGVNATPAQAEEMHAFIRSILSDKFGRETSEKIRIIYGGSVKPDNMKELMAEKDIDGALVGGASLDAKSFEKIVKF
ncbi:triose-phosphate isomerase, partial [Candidatus Woesearchaeota archaeon]|nr:triose-phosphate isomerase [Candidatus Woesearchaeota archaeon]